MSDNKNPGETPKDDESLAAGDATTKPPIKGIIAGTELEAWADKIIEQHKNPDKKIKPVPLSVEHQNILDELKTELEPLAQDWTDATEEAVPKIPASTPKSKIVMNETDIDNQSTHDAPRRRINSGQVYGTIFFVAVIGCGVWYLINYFSTQAREKHATEMRQQQTDASIAALALKYNAVTNWEALLPDRGGAQPFSIDVSSALISSESGKDDPLGIETKPVLIKCTINDIFKKDGKIIASLSSADTTNSLSLELQCSPAKAITFYTNQLSIFFAVVFKCQEAQRLSSSDGDGFSVKGELLDVVQLP